jgi:uncharacterized membrane protein (DUF4010 family)
MLIAVTVMPIAFGMISRPPPDPSAPAAAGPVTAAVTLAAIVLLALFGGAVTFVRLREVEIVEDFSLAGVTAALAVFVLGAIAVSGDMEIAGAGAVAVAIVLAARRSAHAFLEKITWLELRAALVLLAMTLIALPLLPNRTIDPWDALNPFELWLLTVMIALISCTGYAAIRIAGPSRGIVFAGAAGGLASSTATTLSFARFAAKAPDNARRLAAGAIIAGALSAGRVAIIGGALAPQLIRPLGLAMAPVVVIFLVAAWLLIRRSQSGAKTPGLNLDNPLDLAGVLRFGALLGGVTLASRLLLDWLGAGTLYLVAAVSGLVDVDAITLSTICRLHPPRGQRMMRRRLCFQGRAHVFRKIPAIPRQGLQGRGFHQCARGAPGADPRRISRAQGPLCRIQCAGHDPVLRLGPDPLARGGRGRTRRPAQGRRRRDAGAEQAQTLRIL